MAETCGKVNYAVYCDTILRFSYRKKQGVGGIVYKSFAFCPALLCKKAAVSRPLLQQKEIRRRA